MSSDNPKLVRLRNALLVSIAILYVARIPLASRLNVNWDEFRFLSVVYDHAQGRLSTALQTSHVHLFQWLVGLGATEVDQVVAARLSYLALVGVSAICLYGIARRFMNLTASLFVVLCYLAYSNLIQHGASFRTDGLAGFLILVCLFILFGKAQTLSRVAAAGTTLALAFLVTVKTVLWLPTLFLIVWVGDAPGRQRQLSRLGRLILFGLVAGLVFTLGFLLHRHSLSSAPLVQAVQNTKAAGVKVFSAGLVPQGRYLVLTVAENIYIWICLLAGVLVICNRFRNTGLGVERRWILLALAIPVMSVVVYRNSFPYFYVFAIPPVLLWAGFLWNRLVEAGERRAGTWVHPLLLVLLVTVAGSGLVHVGRNVKDRTGPQRTVLSVVHDLFPEPVPYIDRSSMVSSFPKVGFFMSTWGLENYWRDGIPIFPGLLRSRAPAFIVRNSPVLELGETARELVSPPYVLLPEDRRALRENFVTFWGPLYVAGKEFHLAPGQERPLEFLIRGRYRVYSRHPILVDGRQVAPGDLVNVEVGTYSVVNEGEEQTVRMRIEVAHVDSLPSPPSEPIFTGF